MPGRSETVDITYRARLDQLEAEIKRLPGLSGDAAKKAVKALDKQWRKAERDSARAAKRSSKAWGSSLKSVGEAGDRIASELGGVFGDVGGAISTLVESGATVGASLGPMGAAAVVATAAFAGLTLGAGFLSSKLLEVVTDATATFDAMTALQKARLDPAAAAGAEELSAAVKGLGEAADLAKVSFAGLAGGPLTSFVDTLTGSVVMSKNAAEAWHGFLTRLDHSVPALGGVTRALNEWMNPLGAALGVVQEIGREWREGAAGLGADVAAERGLMFADLAADLEKGKAGAKGFLKFLADFREREADASAKAREAREAWVAAQEAGRKAQEEVDKAAIRAEESLQAELALFEGLITALGGNGVAGGVAEASAAMDAFGADVGRVVGDAAAQMETLKVAVQDQFIASIDQSLVALQATAGSVADSFATFAGLRADKMESEAQTARANRKETLQGIREEQTARADAALEAGDLTEAEHAAELKRIDQQLASRRKAAKALEREQLKAARQAHSFQQGVQIAQAAMDSARAAISLIPFFSFLGFGAPLAAAGVAGAALAAQTAVIKAQPKPSFPDGGSVGARASGHEDHVDITARRDEGIVSPMGMAALGGAAGLARVNQGVAPTGGGGVNLLQIDGRIIGALVSQAVRSGTVAATLAAQAGRVPGQLPLTTGR